MSLLCLHCSGEKFTEKITSVPQSFRGEDTTVQALAMVCDHCGWFTMTDAQADELCVITADDYRSCHGFLTSKEIVSRRNDLQMSQIEFAKFIGVGIASVKRWERSCIQERIYDDRIRNKTRQMQKVIYGAENIYVLHCVYTSVTTSKVLSIQSYPNQQIVVKPKITELRSRTNEEILLRNASKWRKEHFLCNDIAFTTSA